MKIVPLGKTNRNRICKYAVCSDLSEWNYFSLLGKTSGAVTQSTCCRTICTPYASRIKVFSMRVPWVPSQTFIVRLFPLPSLHIRVSRDYGWRMLTSIRPTLPQRLVCYRYNFSPSHVTCCSSIAIKYRHYCPNRPDT